MQDLQLIGMHEDGEHLLLSGPGDERFQMRVDEELRAAVRHDRPRLGQHGQQQADADTQLRPRDVQALIRAGASTDEAASRAGWSVEKVHRYEGPILAEREHVAGLGQQARLRSHTSVSSSGSAPTLSVRVGERLASRDVDIADASWDSRRSEGGPWTVVLTFAAGGRQRQASWVFDLADRTVSAMDDEARWLSEEISQSEGPIPAPQLRSGSGRESMVYDVEAEGGLRAQPRDEHQDDPLDLMTAMRRRSTVRGRRKPGVRGAAGGSTKAASSAGDAEKHPTEQALPAQSIERDTEHERDTQLEHETQHEREQAAAVIGLAAEAVSVEDAARESAPHKTAHAMSEEAAQIVEASAAEGGSTAQPKRPARDAARKSGRPSVPAWDEIIFGSRPGANRSSS